MGTVSRSSSSSGPLTHSQAWARRRSARWRSNRRDAASSPGPRRPAETSSASPAAQVACRARRRWADRIARRAVTGRRPAASPASRTSAGRRLAARRASGPPGPAGPRRRRRRPRPPRTRPGRRTPRAARTAPAARRRAGRRTTRRRRAATGAAPSPCDGRRAGPERLVELAEETAAARARRRGRRPAPAPAAGRRAGGRPRRRALRRPRPGPSGSGSAARMRSVRSAAGVGRVQRFDPDDALTVDPERLAAGDEQVDPVRSGADRLDQPGRLVQRRARSCRTPAAGGARRAARRPGRRTHPGRPPPCPRPPSAVRPRAPPRRRRGRPRRTRPARRRRRSGSPRPPRRRAGPAASCRHRPDRRA